MYDRTRTVHVETERCKGCGRCVRVCPGHAIILIDRHATIDQNRCLGCMTCIASCPVGAIHSSDRVPQTSPGLTGDIAISGPWKLKHDLTILSSRIQRLKHRVAALDSKKK